MTARFQSLLEAKKYPAFTKKNRSLKDMLLSCILLCYSNLKDEQKEGNCQDIPEEFFVFVEVLTEYIADLDEDIEKYSPSKMKIMMDLNGFDIDDCYRFINLLKTKCVNMMIGVIDIMKPLSLENNYIALIDF